jgi:hypothetical protein
MTEIKKDCGGEIPTPTILSFSEMVSKVIGRVAAELKMLDDAARLLRRMFVAHLEHCPQCRSAQDAAEAEKSELERIVKEEGPLGALRFVLERAHAEGGGEWPSVLGGGDAGDGQKRSKSVSDRKGFGVARACAISARLVARACARGVRIRCRFYAGLSCFPSLAAKVSRIGIFGSDFHV